MKQCFRCKEEKPETDFYTDPRMNDGHVGKCKECTRRDVRINRAKRLEYYRKYDTNRNKGSARRILHRIANKRRVQLHPEKRIAAQVVANAIREGKLIRQPCEVCGAAKVEAHHDDYFQPLNVRWLCSRHHHDLMFIDAPSVNSENDMESSNV